MLILLRTISNYAAILGILLCLVAGITRVLGDYYLFDYSVVTIFDAGVALMVLACLIKLHQLTTDKLL